jgi:hypothetical protein
MVSSYEETFFEYTEVVQLSNLTEWKRKTKIFYARRLFYVDFIDLSIYLQ